LAQTTVLNLTPNGNEGAIWGSGAGMAADGNGNIFLLDANGDFDTNLNSAGFPRDGDFGNAFLKLSTKVGLAVADYFEMDNEQQENNSDTDLGSGGALLLPPMKDSSGKIWQLAAGAGKDSNLYIVNCNSMGKFNPNGNNIYQELVGVLPGGIWSMPAFFQGKLYFGPVGQPILAFQFNNAQLSPAPVAQTSNRFGYPGATPSVSANNGQNGIVWASANTNPAVLYAYNAKNLHELYDSNQAANGRDHFGAGNKFITPMIANGKVYVGTTNGVGVFGLLSAPSAGAPAGGSQISSGR
jgi:outer membrane protein assembly factor BamB